MHMCVYIYVYIYMIYTYICIYTYMHIYTHIHISNDAGDPAHNARARTGRRHTTGVHHRPLPPRVRC